MLGREREDLGEKRGVGFAEKREAEVAEHAICVGLGFRSARRKEREVEMGLGLE